MVLAFSHQNPEILLSINPLKISCKKIITFVDAITLKLGIKLWEN